MVGLQRGKVALAEYEDSWRESFSVERDRILKSSGDLIQEVLHVGSTSVQGLCAKPIIDIALVLNNFDKLSELSRILLGLGWIDRGWVREDNYLFVMESHPEVRTHHLHVVTEKSDQLKEYVMFKDALEGSEALVSEYGKLKRKLASAHPDDRETYTNSKGEFIQRVLSVCKQTT